MPPRRPPDEDVDEYAAFERRDVLRPSRRDVDAMSDFIEAPPRPRLPDAAAERYRHAVYRCHDDAADIAAERRPDGADEPRLLRCLSLFLY